MVGLSCSYTVFSNKLAIYGNVRRVSKCTCLSKKKNVCKNDVSNLGLDPATVYRQLPGSEQLDWC